MIARILYRWQPEDLNMEFLADIAYGPLDDLFTLREREEIASIGENCEFTENEMYAAAAALNRAGNIAKINQKTAPFAEAATKASATLIDAFVAAKQRITCLPPT